jgi:hypothetical protein
MVYTGYMVSRYKARQQSELLHSKHDSNIDKVDY